MDIHRKVGSKERLVEMFQNVNKVLINENLGDLNEANAVLEEKFEQLKKNELNIKSTNTQLDGDESYVELRCVDNKNNEIVFSFKVITTEDEQDGVFGVESVDLHSFNFESPDDQMTLNMEEDSLKDFNNKHNGEYFDLIDKHINVEDKLGTLDDDVNEEEKNKKISDPFGGSSNELQTGKAFADEKPTNDKLRVKSPELDKFIDEEEDIEQINNDKEEVGDIIQGGLADDNLPLDFNKEQILMGIEVEMEHTNDPMVAVEIAMDHLKEIPDYYTHLTSMENNLGDNPEKTEDEVETNALLGYEPKNVGDEID